MCPGNCCGLLLQFLRQTADEFLQRTVDAVMENKLDSYKIIEDNLQDFAAETLYCIGQEMLLIFVQYILQIP